MVLDQAWIWPRSKKLDSNAGFPRTFPFYSLQEFEGDIHRPHYRGEVPCGWIDRLFFASLAFFAYLAGCVSFLVRRGRFRIQASKGQIISSVSGHGRFRVHRLTTLSRGFNPRICEQFLKKYTSPDDLHSRPVHIPVRNVTPAANTRP
ncbi:hypothetical protein K469DRAFT_390881 [Zopfia rhizophila CBS 207.26]|uniref:Uncharacterized protein n=1 Tax=Zopfia rhizophila CBS 207.26 TaxID=1314779 RepID=A0A6A6EJ41_9PEZI|nr:hypothetical protein K469DRAFT_390881 [Zopfia rhizophila CBS 207.26]